MTRWTGRLVVSSVLLAATGIGTTRVTAAIGQAGSTTAEAKGGDVDRVVPYPVEQVLAAAKAAFATYGCDVKKERPDYLECTRDRHVGIAVGSGGEKVTVRLTAKDGGTRVVVETGKGFVGRLGKKNWSTPIFNDMLKSLSGS